VDREVGLSICVLKALAASEQLSAGDLRGFDKFARSVLATRHEWETIVLYDPPGQQLVNLRIPFGAPLPVAGDPKTLDTAVRTRTPEVSNLFTARVGKQHIINVYVPVVLGGAVRKVLAASLPPLR
jgi:hypothetical protein